MDGLTRPKVTPELMARWQREAAELDWGALSGTERIEPERCGVCGELWRSWIEDESKRCRCAESRARARVALAQADPDGRMTLDSLERPDPSVARAREAGVGAVTGERRRGVVMFGAPGRGKTHLMVGLCRLALDVGRTAVWHNAPVLVERIQDTYSDDAGPTRRQVIEALCRYEVVMLDDLGWERASADVAGIMYEVVDGLYRARRTVVASTNLGAREFEKRYDAAVVSRLREMAEFLKIEGRDRRREVDYG